jgi:peptidoglycan hydrolase-like protein with peptidoglycan-binding domain
MSKRNFILLTIVLVIIIIIIFGFLYFQQKSTTPGEEGTNFISQFNPFGTSKPTTTPTDTLPVDVSGYQPNPEEEIKLQLVKISSMPVAGFTVYQKERLKDVPVVIPTEVSTEIPYNFGNITLKNGSNGEEVKEIQRFLNSTLNLTLELDGILDEEVTIAIKQWQNTNKLVADGIVGAKTKNVMYASVNQKIATDKPTPPATEFMPALRYVARTTGNVYQTFADKIEERRFSVTVIPKVYEAFFGNKGESVIMRYLKGDNKTITTFVGSLPKEVLGGDTTENNEVKGTFLPDDVQDVSLSSDASSIFYLFNVGDNIVGTTLSLITNKKVQLFDSPFTEWLSSYPNSRMVTLTTKPSSGIPGYMYALDTGNKSFTQALGNINGLTTLASPSGKIILYGNDNLSLGIYYTDTKVSELLGVKTLPEKCVWGKGNDIVYCGVPKAISAGGYPDAWYQGETSFSDQIWKIDIKNGNATMIADPITLDGGEDIDSIKLALDQDENYLFFVNKKDSYLWELKLR